VFSLRDPPRSCVVAAKYVASTNEMQSSFVPCSGS